MSTPLGLALRRLRKASRYPRMKDFAYRAGFSHGGYEKMECGARFPSRESLEQIIHFGQFSAKGADELRLEWEKMALSKAGLRARFKCVDYKMLTEKIYAETKVMLKQCQARVPQAHLQAFRNRLEIILRAALEET